MKPLAQNTLIQNRYLIVQLIGKGGMGEVYLAVDQRLGSAIALKRTFFAGDEELGSAFEREARVLARMRHPVLPKVSDHFGEGDEQFLVMEHISGDDLSKRIETAQKPFPVSWVMFWADQLLDALSYLHSHEPPIIHRDIKPQNLKLTDENHIVLLDFGLSKSSTGQTNLGSGSSTGSVVGYTPHYAPMEQIRGVGTSARSDIYALSATLYQLLSNTVPSDALSRADSMLNRIEDPVQPLYELNQEIPKSISDVIAKGMEVSQEKRFETAREMQRALRKAYSEMQNAMSAKTVVISGSDLAGDTGTSSGDSGTAAPAEPAEALAPDFGATLVLDEFPKASPEEPQQSGIKTEVFIPGSLAYTPEPSSYEPERSVNEAQNAEQEFRGESEPAVPDFGMTNVYSSEGQGVSDEGDEQAFEPNATVPVIAFDPASAGFARDFEQEVSSDANSQGLASEPKAAAVSASGGSSAPKKKKGGAGKAIGILAVLALLFVLGLGAVGGVWYYMAYIREEPATTPTPTPEETPAATPEPSPTADIAVPSPTETPEPTPEETPTPDTAPTLRPPEGPRSTPVRTPAGPRPSPVRTPVPVRTPLPRRTPLP